MDRRSEDEAWRAIVENYGDRPEVAVEDEPPAEAPPLFAAPPAEAPPLFAASPASPPLFEVPLPSPRDEDADEAEDGFVPPTPPPLPRTTPRRLVAWCGVLGAPAALVLLLLVGVTLPTFAALLLVAWFVGGFCYLVLAMPSGPRDPWDDGARV